MKLTRWALAGASAYVVYKYAIGKKAKGEDVFVSADDDTPPRESAAPRKPSKRQPKKV